MAGRLRLVAALIAGYALGTIPSTELAARSSGHPRRHVHEEGTGNPGALNVSHVLGRRRGVAVSIVDVAKGVAAAGVGRRLAGERGANLAATAAVVGHCHPPGRRGGKGVATSVGQVIGTFPAYLPIDVAVALVVAALPGSRRRTETATAVASLAWVGCGFAWWKSGRSCGRGCPTDLAVPMAALASAIVILARFRAESARVDARNQRLVAS